MDGGPLYLLVNPAILLFFICTIISIFGKFFKIWVITTIGCAIMTAVVIVLGITAGQFLGAEDYIRYYITSSYTVMGVVRFYFRDILLFVWILVSFQMSLAAHTLKIEEKITKSLMRIHRKRSCQFEMENTLQLFSSHKGKK